MNVLIVHAHPEPKSFTSAMCRTAASELGARGHVVALSDLYAMGFDPVAKSEDFLDRSNPDYLTYALEQRHAYAHGTLRCDIAREIDKLVSCDLLILSFPVFWFSVPAIMKGWIDRVLISGLAYGGRRVYERGGFTGRKALIAATLGGRAHMFGERALHGPMEDMLRPLVRGTLQYVGFEVLPPFLAFHVPYVSEAERKDILSRYKAYLTGIDTLETQEPPKLDGFDETFRPIT
jgi:NAD(P)H dehydrogenase (quinone)